MRPRPHRPKGWQPLAEALRLLAASAEDQRRALPAWVAMPDEVALVFQDAVAVLDPRGFSTEEWHAVQEVLVKVNDLWDRDDPHDWSDTALEESESWARLRRAARDAMSKLGLSPGQPTLHGSHYVATGRTPFETRERH